MLMYPPTSRAPTSIDPAPTPARPDLAVARRLLRCRGRRTGFGAQFQHTQPHGPQVIEDADAGMSPSRPRPPRIRSFRVSSSFGRPRPAGRGVDELLPPRSPEGDPHRFAAFGTGTSGRPPRQARATAPLQRKGPRQTAARYLRSRLPRTTTWRLPSSVPSAPIWTPSTGYQSSPSYGSGWAKSTRSRRSRSGPTPYW